MTGAPFPADPGIAERWAAIRSERGDAFLRRLESLRASGSADPVHPVAVLPAAAVGALTAEFGLADAVDAAVLALDAAAALARPPISGYRVGVVGIGGRGDLYLGGNLEFPGAAITHTVHAEGFAALLARARGDRLAVLASAQARPCAHCRQVLAEFDGGLDLRLVDRLGHDLRLADVYPWPFAPGDLGRSGARAGQGLPGGPEAGEESPAGLEGADALPSGVRDALLAAGRRAHAPYSGSRSALVLRLGDGTLLGGAVLESVAFNPTVGPLQDALVGLVAAGRSYHDIAEAWLAVNRRASVNHEAPARDLLAAVADAPLHTTYWAETPPH